MITPSKNKKGQFWLLSYIIVICIIAILLIFFYIWVREDVSVASRNQAEIITAELEYRTFFSELIHAHGINIAHKDDGDVEDILEKYATNYATIPKGGYDASCHTEGIDKKCLLEITIYNAASTIWTATFFTGLGPYTAPAYILMKLTSLDILKTTSQEAYLPIKGGKAMKFTLDVSVEAV
ncbi:MAG: hypothetical protein QW165_03685 [Candidatus Woesearchaeota archaeon]